MNEPELAKLSDAADQCGIPAGGLKITATYDLLPQVVRGRGGHVHFPWDLERLAIVRHHGA
ncbi:hypothetical protein [Mycolicibacterium peregrinum]|uniref:Uncharacterized protein n=1 Tax=Mycolicibacterium peregrinum TaxID=43304 RepID=A0A1A0VU72_MYCPR|nr:hypothetical protein [Mycolicibacterium peregrinum]OBB86782.1 hypothetical protein A5779_00185 [Mycolicibacterium peregrinum]